MLRIPKNRRQVYFGGDKSPHDVQKFVRHCHDMRLARQNRDFMRLQHLHRLFRSIEMRRKFRDWCLYVLCRRIKRKHILRTHLTAWWKAALFRRYGTFFAVLHNPIYLLKQFLFRWKEVTLYLRSLWFYNCTLKRKTLQALKYHMLMARKILLRKVYDRWLEYIEVCKHFHRMQSLIKCSRRLCFLKWKRLTLDIYKVDLSDLLERIRLRKLRELFEILCQLFEKFQHDRVLENLNISKDESFVEVVKTDAPKRKKMIRKAPLDNYLTICDCVSKVCHGHRPSCSFKQHFRRRVNLCYQQYDSAVEDKHIAAEINRYKPKVQSPQTPERSPSAFEMRDPEYVKRSLEMKVVQSPERTRKIVTEKVRGSIAHEPLSHWPKQKKIPRHSSDASYARDSANAKSLISSNEYSEDEFES